MNYINYSRINRGRQRIVVDFDEVTPYNVCDVLKKVIPKHDLNRKDCEYLINYFLGEQDILYRTDVENSNVNNKTVMNYAYPITREIVGYTHGNPIEFIQKKLDKQESVKTLSDIYSYENAHYIDTCCAIYQSICGLGYEMTLPSADINKDFTPEVPITYMSLDPRETFVVYSTSIGNPQIMSGTITRNSEGKKVYNVFTNNYKFVVINNDEQTLQTEINPIGLDPITMFENNLFLMGDWEMAISVLNGINQVTSDSLNDIEGTIRSLLVLIGAELEDDSESAEKIKKNRLLTLVNANGGNIDAKFISPVLDSISVENIRNYLDEAKNIITGIPDRQGNSSGGDTGQAVLNRDGWTDMEIVARLKELFFKKAKKRQVEVGIRILKKLGVINDDLSVLDLDIVIARHSTDNLQTKTQAFSTLVATGELATIDCLNLANLTNKSTEMVERGEKEKEKRQEQALELAKQTVNNEDDTDNNTVEE